MQAISFLHSVIEQSQIPRWLHPLRYGMVGLGLMLMLWSYNPARAIAQTDPAALAKAVQEIEYLDATRSGLASTLEGSTEEPTLETMKTVCRPVGMRAMELSKENGWQVKQMAQKYRNPAHAPDTLQARMALAQFEQHSDQMGFWERETLEDQTGTRYYRRIDVEASCLACHGLKDHRPQFVKESYPDDRAYNFNVGDLRGMYAVFIPDAVQQQVNQALNPSLNQAL